jgi:hypothetical protein
MRRILPMLAAAPPRTFMRALDSARALFVTIAAVLAIATVTPVQAAETETWLCPICQVQEIQREVGSKELHCPACDITMTHEDLKLPVAYLSSRTRPTSAVWNVVPECGIFRDDGLAAQGANRRPIWIPWSAVEYFLPRMRIVRLRGGAEFQTPFAQSDADCPADEQPKFIVTVADSAGDFRGNRSLRTRAVEEKMVTLFIVANSRATLDAARQRFIEEVETGKHPRLPRTPPQARNLPLPGVPPSAANDSLDVVLEARVGDQGYILKVNRMKGSGNDDVDRAAVIAALRAAIVYGGEMGVGVPCSMVLTYHFNRGTVTAEAKPAEPPMWREWVWPPEEPR